MGLPVPTPTISTEAGTKTLLCAMPCTRGTSLCNLSSSLAETPAPLDNIPSSVALFLGKSSLRDQAWGLQMSLIHQQCSILQRKEINSFLNYKAIQVSNLRTLRIQMGATTASELIS